MKFLFTSCFLLFTSAVFCQEVKKMKITDVEAYIKNSDHPVVVNFWATWCAPCVEEIPYFIETVKKYNADRVELVLVSLDFPNYYPKLINDFIKKKQFSATFFWLHETNADYFCPKIDTKWDGTIPVTLLVNNKTGYRTFFNRALTDRQIELEISKLVGKGKG
jgi:thiol-disulfide isomerase/thioredoxin